MVTKELQKLLKRRKEELLDELRSIDVLLGVYNDSAISSQGNEILSEPQISNAPKIVVDDLVNDISGDDVKLLKFKAKTVEVTWKDYLYDAVKVFGRTKVAAVIDLVVQANEGRITSQRVKDAAGNKLKELVDEGKLGVEAASSRKLGYTYFII